MKKELLGSIKENSLTEFISSYYNRFTKEELKTIIVELEIASTRGKRATEEMLEELEERL